MSSSLLWGDIVSYQYSSRNYLHAKLQINKLVGDWSKSGKQREKTVGFSKGSRNIGVMNKIIAFLRNNSLRSNGAACTYKVCTTHGNIYDGMAIRNSGNLRSSDFIQRLGFERWNEPKMDHENQLEAITGRAEFTGE